MIIVFTSCKFFSKENNLPIQEIDTIVDFSSVDVSPSFTVCDKLLGEAKTNCFQTNMQTLMTKQLQKVTLVFKEEVLDTISIVLHIDAQGNVKLKRVIYPSLFYDKQLTFDEQVSNAIKSLPQLQPAIKRGIPVATEYTLPVIIYIK